MEQANYIRIANTLARYHGEYDTEALLCERGLVLVAWTHVPSGRVGIASTEIYGDESLRQIAESASELGLADWDVRWSDDDGQRGEEYDDLAARWESRMASVRTEAQS